MHDCFCVNVENGNIVRAAMVGRRLELKETEHDEGYDAITNISGRCEIIAVQEVLHEAECEDENELQPTHRRHIETPD